MGRARAALLLDQLNQDSPGAPGVEEGDEAVVRSLSRVLVDQFDAGGSDSVEGGLEIGNPVRQMMQPGASPLQEPGDRGGVGKRLEEFQSSDPFTNEGDVDALVFDALHRRPLPTGQELEQGKGLFDRSNGDRNVIEG